MRHDPLLPPERRNASIAPSVNPYIRQDHLYSKTRPETFGFLRRLRDLIDGFGERVLLGEVGEAQRGREVMEACTAGGDKLHMCYGFDLLGPEPPTPERLRVLASLLLSLRASACLYQGEELGLTEAELDFDEVRDPYGRRFWPSFKGRDGCGTPMPWRAEPPGAGFTEAARPWLPIPPEHRPLAVDRQAQDPGSTLAHDRAMLAFRRAHPALRPGALEPAALHEDLVAFLRRDGAETLLCVFNLTDRPVETALPAALARARAITHPDARGAIADGRATLPPQGARFAAVEGAAAPAGRGPAT